jgi:hypothetical protein
MKSKGEVLSVHKKGTAHSKRKKKLEHHKDKELNELIRKHGDRVKVLQD